MSKNAFEDFKMSAACEASSLLRQLAEPRPAGDSVKAAINRAARRVQFTAVRATAIWYRLARVIRAEEMDALRRAADQRREEQEGRHEYRELLDRLSILENRLATTDEDFFGPTLAAVGESMRQPRGARGPVDSE